MTAPVRALARRVRRVLVPEWTSVLHDLAVLRSDRDNLLSDVRTMRDQIAELHRRTDALQSELDEVRARTDAHEGEVDENRRLSARVAEVTDLVTEVVLPLHDREVDVRRLRPEGTEPA